MAGIAAVNGHVDDGAGFVAVVVFHAQPLHELPVAAGNGVAIHQGGDALAADLLDIADPAAVQGLAVGGLQALGDGVGGGAFGQGGVL